MKKLFIILVLSCFCFTGCLGGNGFKLKSPITFNSDMKELTVLMVAEALGEKFANEYPGKVKYAEKRIEELFDLQMDNNFQLLFEKSINELSKELSNNPSTRKKLQIVLSKIEVKADIGLNREVVEAFKIGLSN